MNYYINKKAFTFIEFIILIVILFLLISMATPQHGWKGGVKGRRNREKNCFINIRVLTGAVDFYNMNVDEKSMMTSLNQEILFKQKYLKQIIIGTESECNYLTAGDLTNGGYIYCEYHGEPTQKLRKSKRF